MTHSQPLPRRLAFWAEHLRQCTLRGQRLSHYAAEHGLSASSLYAARSTLRQRGLWPLPPTRFLRVEANQGGRTGGTPDVAPALYRIALPNGVVVETAGGELDAVLAAAAALS